MPTDPQTTAERIRQGLEAATQAPVRIVRCEGRVRTFHEIRMDEKRLRLTLEKIARATDADEMQRLAREALNG